MVAGFVLTAGPAWAKTIHVDCSKQSLQSKLNSAPAGATLRVSGTCVGNFILSKSLTLEGFPKATLDGNQTGSTLQLTGSPTVHLSKLIITRGLATRGGGINSQGGRLTLNHVVVQDSSAVGDKAQGGGIYKRSGSLTIMASRIVHDVADTVSNEPITDSQGGGIFMPAGPLTISGSTVAHDQSICHTPGQSQALGGGVDYEGTFIATHITGSHIDDNRAVATGNIAVAAGGGAYLLANFSITHSTLSGNVAQGTASGADSQVVVAGSGLAGASPTVPSSISSTVISANQASLASTGSGATANFQGTVNFGGSLTMTSSRIGGNRASVDSAGSAMGTGGGLILGRRLTLRNLIVSSNVVTVHAGTGDATAAAGGLEGAGSSSLTMTRSTVAGNIVQASSDGGDATTLAGGINAFGRSFALKASTVSGNRSRASVSGVTTASAHAGGIELGGSSATDAVANSTIAGNMVTSEGASAFAAGGGIESTAAALTITNATIARNRASERGGGLLVGGGSTTLEGTILALNTAPPGAGPNCRGTVQSAGHNLLGTVAGCVFNSKPATDKLNKSPGIGQLKNNGGPTQTMAVQPGSLALNAIPKAACAVTTDQRGVHRPQGSGCEIGSYEVKV